MRPFEQPLMFNALLQKLSLLSLLPLGLLLLIYEGTGGDPSPTNANQLQPVGCHLIDL